MGDAHGFFEWMGVSEIAGTWASGRVHNLLPVQERRQGAAAVTGMSFLR